MHKYEIIRIKVCEWIILINNRFKMTGVSMTKVSGKLCTDKKCYYNNKKRQVKHEIVCEMFADTFQTVCLHRVIVSVEYLQNKQ
jgi:hypothetical protein